MFAEAIPGVIIQQLAILTDGRASVAAITSLTISALTTGFVSASISFDWDTDVMWRKLAPDFYGYIPNDAGKRTGNAIAMEDKHERYRSTPLQNTNSCFFSFSLSPFQSCFYR